MLMKENDNDHDKDSNCQSDNEETKIKNMSDGKAKDEVKTEVKVEVKEETTEPNQTKEGDTENDGGEDDDDTVKTSPKNKMATTFSSSEVPAAVTSASDEYDHEDEEPSQVTLSQTDEHIRKLDKNGQLGEVVGSQSLLSQELIYSARRHEDDDDVDVDDDNENGGGEEQNHKVPGSGVVVGVGVTRRGGNDEDEDDCEAVQADSQLTECRFESQQTMPYSQIDSQCFEGLSNPHYGDSQRTETSILMAQRLGLLNGENDEPQSQQSAFNSPVESFRKASIGAFRRRVLGHDGLAPPPPRQHPTPVRKKRDSSSPGSSGGGSYHGASRKTVTPTSPVRDGGGLGSLLGAVEVLSQQEDEEEATAALCSVRYGRPPSHLTSEPSERKRPAKKPSAKSVSTSSRGSSSSSSKRKATSPPAIDNSSSSSKKKTEKRQKTPKKNAAAQKKDNEQHKAQEIAKRAAALAEKTVADPEMAKKLLLSMALVRENPRSLPETWPARGSVVPEGFFWAHYPPLEKVLKKHMAEYYELSTTKCQSAQQQTFNNDLVVVVRQVADEQGWEFHECFTDKSLRDRIRCYYKTHIQNAKKRLRTMVQNPTKRANARHLCAHLDLIEQHGAKMKKEKSSKSRGSSASSSSSASPSSSTPSSSSGSSSSRKKDKKSSSSSSKTKGSSASKIKVKKEGSKKIKASTTAVAVAVVAPSSK